MLLSLLAALVAASAPAAPAADASKAYPFPVEMHALPNGLRVAFIQYDAPGLVAYYTLMRVGSRNEVEKGRSGFAHFFEHMMFRGTKQHSAEDYNQTMTRLGLDTNAFTSEDMTVYHLYGPAKALPTIIEYESDRFQNLSYDEPAFRTEAGAILGEYVKSASNPGQKMYEKMVETAFTRHTYGHTVIGYLKDIENMPSGYEYSRQFFRRYYTPDNAIIFVVVMGALFSITLGVDAGVRNIPPVYLKAARNLGTRGIALYTDVIFPAAFPTIVSGLKQGWSFAWRSLMAGELLYNTVSLGNLLESGRDLLDSAQVISVMLLIIVIGVLIDSLVFGPLERMTRSRWGLI